MEKQITQTKKQDEIVSNTTPARRRCQNCGKVYYQIRGCDCERLKNHTQEIGRRKK